MTVKRGLTVLLAVVISIFTTACTPQVRQAMLDFMGLSQVTEVTLAIAIPYGYVQDNTGFLNGVELARSELETMQIPVRLNLRIDDDAGSFSDAIVLAQTYIADPNIIGVVGHWYSDICESIASIYVSGETPLLLPTLSVASVTDEAGGYIFSAIPSEQQIAQKMCNYMIKQGGKTAAIYYEDSVYGFMLSSSLEKYADSLGVKIIDRVCEPTLDKEVPKLAQKWSAMDYDTVFVVSNVEEGVTFINRLRQLGYQGRIICSDSMDSQSLPLLLDDTRQSVVVCSIFNNNSPTSDLKRVQQRYRNRFEKEADVWAIQGYDCVMIVANALAKHNVKTKEQLSAYFQNAEEVESIFGHAFFDKNGQIIGKQVYLKRIQNGEVQFIS